MGLSVNTAECEEEFKRRVGPGGEESWMCWMLMLCTDRRAVSNAKHKSQQAKEKPDMEMYLFGYMALAVERWQRFGRWISVDS